jgi:VCBS repeat-containing protein
MSYAKTCSLESRSYSQERDDGYYAYHLYVTFPVKVFDLSWNVVDVTSEVEIQATTQLQEVLRSLTHHFYAANRLQRDRSGKWKWEFGSTQFKVGYLSHTLHLLESVIVESRDRLLSEDRRNG